MGTKLYVGSLSYSIDDKELENIFSTSGEVKSAKVITDMGTGRSKGFGFVEMTNEEDAKKAIQSLNGSTHQGRAILVSEARPQTGGGGRGGDRSGGGRGGFGGGGNRDRGGNGGGRRGGGDSWR